MAIASALAERLHDAACKAEQHHDGNCGRKRTGWVHGETPCVKTESG
jgi:hypothetical protein